MKHRQKRFWNIGSQNVETKEWKNGWQINPDIVNKFKGIWSFNKPDEVKSVPCDEQDEMIGSSDAGNVESSEALTSSNSSVFSSSSSSSSASASSSSDSSATSSSSGSSSSNAALVVASNPSSESGSHSTPHRPSNNNNLPTNSEYYSNDDQTFDEFNRQHGISITKNQYFGDKIDVHKRTWSRVVNAPGNFGQKVRKAHADASGLGAFYGTDHFVTKMPKKFLKHKF